MDSPTLCENKRYSSVKIILREAALSASTLSTILVVTRHFLPTVQLSTIYEECEDGLASVWSAWAPAVEQRDLHFVTLLDKVCDTQTQADRRTEKLQTHIA